MTQESEEEPVDFFEKKDLFGQSNPNTLDSTPPGGQDSSRMIHKIV